MIEQEAIDTIWKMSPPFLMVVFVNILTFCIRRFVPDKLLMPIGVISGAAIAPYLFSPGSLAYDVPSPMTALVIIGAIMGFIGVATHDKLRKFLEKKGLRVNGNDTEMFCAPKIEPPVDKPKDWRG